LKSSASVLTERGANRVFFREGITRDVIAAA
jgi:hypothetical protein